ncbi:MAG: FAD-dependent oxidoreductase, partial [Dehalococcoidia bacterium]
CSSDLFDNFVRSLIDLGIPAKAVAGVAQAGPLAAFVADDSWVERPAAPGRALIGDAAGISDPTWGQGMALAFHDVRVLSDWLLSEPNWDIAVDHYATARDTYFQSIITAESWLTELQLTPGDEAAARRTRVMGAWRADPRRAQGLDINGLGPALDVSESARRWIFAEDDVPAQPGDRAAIEFLAGAVRQRDFAAIREAFTGTARMRALLPGGPREVHGSEAIGRSFEGWFGDAEEYEPITTGIDVVADRVRVSWKLRVRWAGEPFSRIIEQQGYAKVVDGRVGMIDLLCSGFRPETSSNTAVRQPAA